VIIYDGPSSSKCPRFSKSQQDSKDFRSKRERRDETAHHRKEPRTKRYLESARVDRFRTSLSSFQPVLTRRLKPWIRGYFLVVDPEQVETLLEQLETKFDDVSSQILERSTYLPPSLPPYTNPEPTNTFSSNPTQWIKCHLGWTPSKLQFRISSTSTFHHYLQAVSPNRLPWHPLGQRLRFDEVPLTSDRALDLRYRMVSSCIDGVWVSGEHVYIFYFDGLILIRSANDCTFESLFLLTSVRFLRCITTFGPAVNRNSKVTCYDLIPIPSDVPDPSIQHLV
jgi:hypothetical protein